MPTRKPHRSPGLKKRLQEARARAEAEALKAHLHEQQAELHALARTLSEPRTLNLVMGPQGGDYLVVLPLPAQDREPLENKLAEIIGGRLAKFQPQQTAYEGLLAYRLANRQRPPRMSYRGFSYNNLDFFVEGTSVKELPTTSAPRPRRAPADMIVPDNAYQPTLNEGELISIALSSESAIKYKLLPLAHSTRKKFPGYRVPFTIRNGAEDIVTYVVGATRGKTGALAGTYLSKGLRSLFAAHPELRVGSVVVLRAVDPGKTYALHTIE